MSRISPRRIFGSDAGGLIGSPLSEKTESPLFLKNALVVSMGGRRQIPYLEGAAKFLGPAPTFMQDIKGRNRARLDRIMDQKRKNASTGKPEMRLELNQAPVFLPRGAAAGLPEISIDHRR